MKSKIPSLLKLKRIRGTALPGFVLLLAFFFTNPVLLLSYTSELVPKPPVVEASGKPVQGGGENFHFFLLGNSYGYVDANGNMPIKPQFKMAENFDIFGLSKVQTESGFGLINHKGEFAVLPLLDDVLVFDSSGSPSVWGLYKNWWGRLSSSGKWLGHPQFNKLTNLGKGFFGVYVKGKAALMDSNGNLKTGYLFDNIGTFVTDEEGRTLSVISTGGKEGILDSSGKILISPAFDKLKPEFDKNGHQIRIENGNYGVLDLSGKWIIEPKFKSIEYNT
ncbi:MAG: WG repeat-containing protein, partial [Deltaproteobacteria bacterium]|nr:WG repeat-containing protein [Deltaproteobacteria bacterium]